MTMPEMLYHRNIRYYDVLELHSANAPQSRVSSTPGCQVDCLNLLMDRTLVCVDAPKL